MLLLSHISGHIIDLFSTSSFLFLKCFFFRFFEKKNKKKRTLFLFLVAHTYYYTSSNFFPTCLPLYLPTTFYFSVALLSSFSLSYILTLLLPILFCTNLISFLQFNSYFPTQKLWVLSLSLSRWIFFLSYNSI